MLWLAWVELEGNERIVTKQPASSMLAGYFVFYSTIFCGQIGYMADFIPTFCVFPLIIGRPCGIVLPQREKTIFL